MSKYGSESILLELGLTFVIMALIALVFFNDIGGAMVEIQRVQGVFK